MPVFALQSIYSQQYIIHGKKLKTLEDLSFHEKTTMRDKGMREDERNKARKLVAKLLIDCIATP